MTLYDYPPRSSGDRRADWEDEPNGSHRATGSATPQYADDTIPGNHFRSGPPRRAPYVDDVRAGGAHHRPEPAVYDSSPRTQAELYESSSRLQASEQSVYDSATRLQSQPPSAPTVYDSSSRLQASDPYESSSRLQGEPPAARGGVYDSSTRLQFEPTTVQPAAGTYPPESAARYRTDTRTQYVADPATRAKYMGDAPAAPAAPAGPVPPVAEWPSAQAAQAALAESAPPTWTPPPAPVSPAGPVTVGAGVAAPRNGKATMIGAILAVAVASAGVTAGIMAAVGGGTTAAAAGPGGLGQGGPAGNLGGGNGGGNNGTAAALHSTSVISDGNGGYTTQLTQTGTVSAVSSSSITVKSQDGYSKTYVVGSSTSIDNGANKISEVTAGHTVRIVATSANSKVTATTITDTNLASVTQQNNQNNQNAQNGQNGQAPVGVPGGQPGAAQNGTGT